MKKNSYRKLRIGLIALMVVLSVLAVVTLTACQNKITVAELSVVEDSVPDVVVAGDFKISDIKLLVITDEGEEVEINAETSMLTSESREALSTPGNQQITLYYQGHTVVLELLVVEAGTETVTVVFVDASGKQIAKKSAVKGGSITAPTAPDVEGKVFVGWVDSAGKEVDLTAVSADVTVKASYSENATKHTVTFYDYNNKEVDSFTVNHGDKISQPSWTKPFEIETYSWGIDFSTYTVTNNTNLYMTVTYKEATVDYKYAFESQPSLSYSLNMVEHVRLGKTTTKKKEAESALRNSGLTFIEWQNTSDVINKDTDMVAIVEDRNFTISFKNNDNPSVTLLTGSKYTLPSTAMQKTGYTFNNKWLGDDNREYSGTLTVTKNLVLEGVYNKKVSPVKITYVFDALIDGGGNTITEEVYDNQTLYNDRIDLAYIEGKYDTIQGKNTKYSKYEIESVMFGGRDVIATGVTLGEVVGNAANEFIVNLIDVSVGTAGLEYEIVGSGETATAKVIAYNGTSTTIFIPDTYEDKPITAIDDGVFEDAVITKLVMPDTIDTLGESVFLNAVFSCDIVLPLIKEMGDGVFTGVTSAYVDEEDHTKGRIAISITFTDGEGVITDIPEGTFAFTEGITSVVLPAGIKKIGEGAFYCTQISSLSSLNNVTEVGDIAFFETSGIETLSLPKVKVIGEMAFGHMNSLTTLTLATETVYEEAEAKLVFDVRSILLSDNIVTLTLGEGVDKVHNDVETYLSSLDPSELSALEAVMAEEGITEYISSHLTTINLPKTLTAIINEDDNLHVYSMFDGLVALRAINAATGSYFASNDGVLYALTEDAAVIAYYPCCKAGDYRVPEQVGGKTVKAIATSFSEVDINTVFINNEITKAIIAARTAGNDTGITSSKVVKNVVFNASVLGEDKAIDIGHMLTGFPCAEVYYIAGTIEGFDEMKEDNGWTNVFIYDESAISKYDGLTGLTYSVMDNKVTILAGDKTAETITIPAQLDNKPVVAIAENAFANYPALTTLNILATIKSIGANAFANDTNLAEITLAAWATDAVIDASVFADTAWANSRNLLVLARKLIYYNDFPEDEANGISTTITAADLAGVTEIPEEFFKNKANLTKVYLSSTITVIGEEAFYGSGLTFIDLNAVMKIANKAFEGCAALESISILRVNDLGNYVFKDCTSLESVEILSAVNGGYIPVGAFQGCTALVTVTLDNIIGLAKDQNGCSFAFQSCSSLEDISFIATFGSIPANAFENCAGIKVIDFTKTAVTSIGESAFDTCVGLEAIVIGSGVTSLAEDAFADCENLQSIQILSNGGILTSDIPDTAFPDPTQFDYVIYVSASADQTALDHYKLYYDHTTGDPLEGSRIKVVLPSVSFSLYPNTAGGNSLNMDDVDTVFIEEPEAPEFAGYVFNAWYVKTGETTYEKATFPMSVTVSVVLYAKYYSVDKGSLVDGDLTYDDESKTYSVTSYAGTDDDTVLIPAEYDGAEGKHPITKVDVGAFASCANLKELILPEGVTVITPTAAGGSALTFVYIPASVTSIADGAFAGATDLDIEFAANSMLKEVTKAAFTGTKWYTESAADAHEGGQNGFVIAGRVAIEYCGGAKQVTLPANLYKLGESVFSGNSTIEDIILNNDLVYIGDNAFANATKLTYVSYYAGSSNATSKIAYVNAGAFAGTSWLDAQNMAIVGTILIKYNNLTGDAIVNIPDYVTVIKANAFESQDAVTTVVFGNGSKLKEIEDYAFKGMNKLASITLPAVDKLGRGVFMGATKLKTADFGKATIEALPADTFSGCSLLETVTLSSAVVSFGEGSFDNCGSLKTINAPGFNDADGFEACGIIYFESTVLKSDCPLYNVTADDENDIYVVIGKMLVRFVPSTAAVGEEGKSIVIPNGVETIYSNVFKETAIKSVTIPASVRVIMDGAFYRAASLENVIFGGNGLEEIGNQAFYQCGALEAIAFPTTLKKIGNKAFEESGLKNVSIPDSVTEIGEKAFYNTVKDEVHTGMEILELGAGITKLGENAFGQNGSLYKVILGWDKDAFDEAIENMPEDDAATDDADEYKLFVRSLFFRDPNPTNIRVYALDGLYNYITTTTDDSAKFWADTVWKDGTDNKGLSTELFTVGNYPQVGFDNDEYYMNSFRTEFIESVGTPARTGHTFMGWYLDEEYNRPLNLPYRVDSDIVLHAKWFKNALGNDESPELTFDESGDSYVIDSITPKPAASKILYINSSYKSKPVVGFEFADVAATTAKIGAIETIVLTNASAFGIPEENIFRYFPALTSVVLLSDDYNDSQIVVNNGVLYSSDGTILIAYLAQMVENDEGNEVRATSFTVPDTVTTILPYAFVNSGLTEITISRYVTAIGEHAFNDELETLNFANNIRLTDADRTSFDNTEWFAASKLDYLVNNSIVGFFYAAGNMLIGYDQKSAANDLTIPDLINGHFITVIAGNISMAADDIEFNRLILPSHLEKINSNAFAGVDVKTNISTTSTVLNDIADSVFENTEYYSSNYSNMLRLGNVLLKWVSSEAIITVPEGIVAISNDAFNGARVQRITLPSTLKYIGDSAFYNCAELKSVTIPDNVVSIADNAFAVCAELTTVNFNVNTSKLESIGDNAFIACRKITNLSLPVNLKSIGEGAFNTCVGLTAIDFDYIEVEDNNGEPVRVVKAKSKLTELGARAFYSCSALTSISVPDGLTAIKSQTFYNCSKLDKVTFDVSASKVSVIESEAFAYCTSLGSTIDLTNPDLVTLDLPNSLVTIGDNAFKACSGLLGVRLNYSVASIGNGVFLACYRLAKIDVYGATPAAIKSDSFDRYDDSNGLRVEALYRLRIYVTSSKNSTTKTEYKNRWTAYRDYIYERSVDIPKLIYRYDDDNSSANNPISADVVVRPQYTFNNTSYDNWRYHAFTTITVVNGVTTRTANDTELRKGVNVATGTGALVQDGYAIVVVDYDEITLQVVTNA